MAGRTETQQEPFTEEMNGGVVSTMTEHEILMKHHHDRLGFISDGGAQGKAIQALLKKFSVEDCIAYYNFQVCQLQPNGLRTSVSWSTVWKQIAEWAKAGKPKTPQDYKRDQVGKSDYEPEEWKPNCRKCWDIGEVWTYAKTEPCECGATYYLDVKEGKCDGNLAA